MQDGICYISDDKSWLGQYKNGSPWNGCYYEYSNITHTTDENYFINGKKVGYDEYCKSRGLEGPGHIFYGIHHVADQKVDQK